MMKVPTVFGLVALCLLGTAIPRVYSACSAATDTSCLYNWPTCGYCDDVGAIEGCNQRATVHLTIDDGPFEFWPTVLDILKWKQVKATFMVVGQQINGANKPFNMAQTMARIVNEGHAIGCHSQTHPHMNTMTVEQMQGEISQCQAAVKSVTGVAPVYFRPPFGECNDICMAQLKAAGLTPIYWNFDTNDWQNNMSLLEKQVDAYPAPPSGNNPVDHSIIGVGPTNSPGLIMLMHMANNMAMCALPAIIDRVRYKGWNFVNADQCYGEASRSTTPIPLQYPTPTQQTAWPACTLDGPLPTIPDSNTVNGCATNNGGCAATGGICSVTSATGGVSCSCGPGFTGNGNTCVDINECATSNGGCDANAKCTNNVGASATCACRAGFTGSGAPGTCANINECAVNNGGCDAVATCSDVTPNAGVGNWEVLRTCTCHVGYSSADEGTKCTQINECATNNGGCGTTCTDYVPLANNNWVMYYCGSCRAGFTDSSNGECSNINECAINNNGVGVCSSVATCTDNTPSDSDPHLYSCGPCPSGYTGDGVVCTDIDECAASSSPCGQDKPFCSNTPGSFTCSATQGNGNGDDSSSGSNGSSTGGNKHDDDDQSQLSGAATLSAGVLITLLAPVLGHFVLTKSQ